MQSWEKSVVTVASRHEMVKGLADWPIPDQSCTLLEKNLIYLQSEVGEAALFFHPLHNVLARKIYFQRKNFCQFTHSGW